MKKYIEKSIDKYANDLSLAMPGHKGKNYFDLDIKRDLTEFLETDNLLSPKGVIKKSQEELARIFSSKYSFYIPNGSSGALNIAISALVKGKDRVLVQRNAHKSIINSIIINDLDPIYIEAKYDEENALFLGIEIEKLEKILETESINLAIFVSPNYYGAILKLREIVDLCHRKGVPVIVDEAHGSHLYFSKLKSLAGNLSGADIVINSTHKTLPSLTQTAILHVNTDVVDRDKILKYINLFTTTSPSFLFLISQEEGISLMEKEGYERLDLLETELGKIKKEEKISSYIIKDPTISAYDPMKFLFRLPNLSGFEIVKKFHLEYNIRLEMGDLYYALAIFSPMTSTKDLRKFTGILGKYKKGQYNKIMRVKFPKPQKLISPRRAFDSGSVFKPLRESKGMICASSIFLYPPGVPLVSYGEKITGEVIDFIEDYLDKGLEVVGINDGKIEVVNESIYNF